MRNVRSLVNMAVRGLATDPCCFHLNATGGPGGVVGQLSDGQIRIGQSNPHVDEAKFCLTSDGTLTDGSDRGCIITSPTGQWQCDAGAVPAKGFSIGCDGHLLHDNNANFWACPTEDNGGFNIYSHKLDGEPKCVEVTLTTDNKDCSSCPPAGYGGGPPPAKPACPGELPPVFEFPHLILPVDTSKPDAKLSTSYNGTACKTTSSIFNFDIPPTAVNKTCTAMFLFPTQDQLETSAFSLSGSGEVRWGHLAAPGEQGMTAATIPKVSRDYGTTTLVPGKPYTLGAFPCPAGQKVGVSMAPEGDTCLNYFQDSNPCPIGLYIGISV